MRVRRTAIGALRIGRTAIRALRIRGTAIGTLWIGRTAIRALRVRGTAIGTGRTGAVASGTSALLGNGTGLLLHRPGSLLGCGSRLLSRRARRSGLRRSGMLLGSGFSTGRLRRGGRGLNGLFGFDRRLLRRLGGSGGSGLLFFLNLLFFFRLLHRLFLLLLHGCGSRLLLFFLCLGGFRRGGLCFRLRRGGRFLFGLRRFRLGGSSGLFRGFGFLGLHRRFFDELFLRLGRGGSRCGGGLGLVVRIRHGERLGVLTQQPLLLGLLFLGAAALLLPGKLVFLLFGQLGQRVRALAHAGQLAQRFFGALQQFPGGILELYFGHVPLAPPCILQSAGTVNVPENKSGAFRPSVRRGRKSPFAPVCRWHAPASRG